MQRLIRFLLILILVSQCSFAQQKKALTFAGDWQVIDEGSHAQAYFDFEVKKKASVVKDLQVKALVYGDGKLIGETNEVSVPRLGMQPVNISFSRIVPQYGVEEFTAQVLYQYKDERGKVQSASFEPAFGDRIEH